MSNLTNMAFPEFANVSTMIDNSNLDSAITGSHFNLYHFNSWVILINKKAGTAGDDPSFVFQQSKDWQGTGAKAWQPDYYYLKYSEQWRRGKWNKQAFTSNTLTFGTLAEYGGIICIPFHKKDVDIQNGFNHVQMSTTASGSSSTDQLTTALLIGMETRWSGNSADTPVV